MSGGQLCRVHAGLTDQAALGRAGAKARKARRGDFVGAIRRQLERDPDRHAERLLASGAKGIELGVELVAKAEAKAGPPKSGASRGRPGESLGTTLADVIALAVETGQEELVLGFVLTEEQRAQVTKGAHAGPESQMERSTPVSGGSSSAPEPGVPLPSKNAGLQSTMPSIGEPNWLARERAAYDAARAQLGLEPDPVTRGLADDERPHRPALVDV
jgi:hypothetical protein